MAASMAVIMDMYMIVLMFVSVLVYMGRAVHGEGTLNT